jgi:putative ATPase
MEAPLAERIRPKKLDDYISQSHLVGPNGSLTQQIAKELSLHYYYGTRGTGNDISTNHCARIKTSFYILSAINSGVKDQDVIEKKQRRRSFYYKESNFIYR